MNLQEYFKTNRPEQCIVGTEWVYRNLWKQLNPSIYLEVGCAHLATFGLYTSWLPKNGLAIGIDINKKINWDTFTTNCPRLLLNGSTTQKEIIDQVKSFLGDRKIDYLFIDGDHNYPAVRSDWNTLAPLVRPGGLIMFHDYDISAVRRGEFGGQGAAMVCEELTKEGYTIECVPNSSVGMAYTYQK